MENFQAEPLHICSASNVAVQGLARQWWIKQDGGMTHSMHTCVHLNAGATSYAAHHISDTWLRKMMSGWKAEAAANVQCSFTIAQQQ